MIDPEQQLQNIDDVKAITHLFAANSMTYNEALKDISALFGFYNEQIPTPMKVAFINIMNSATDEVDKRQNELRMKVSID